ncbi:MAG: hypothetical protein L6R40_002088 [Gallowayella cf. fulva]|nr:MAG: hypothetical protein L6R40_002088 [Xanthomendoza cf. fulva]
MSTPPWQLQIQAITWRNLAKTGFWFNSLAYPRPPNYTFAKSFSTGTYGSSGPKDIVYLYFYLPEGLDLKRRKHAVVVNCHGGGFTLGSATDDRRWASTVLKDTTAIFVSVEYRLAPEHPFPVAVEDCCEAVLHLAASSEEFGIDPTRIALSGFSAGANLVFTVPLMLNSWNDRPERQDDQSLPPFKIISIISFYPLLDYRQGRASKRAASIRPDKSLPPFLTNLFDASYMPDPANASSPFASPAAAPSDMLSQALPAGNIGLYCCEWDMLHAEGLAFAKRLESLGKKVEYESIPEVVHGFDKAPNPMSVDPKADHFHHKACVVLHQAIEKESRNVSTVL